MKTQRRGRPSRSRWSLHFLPSPKPPTRSKDPRVRRAGAVSGLLARLAPGFIEKFSESHYWSPTELEESFLYMLGHNGLSMMNALTAGQEFYERFLDYSDKRPIFRYERLFFTTLDAYRPAGTHWTLKAPNYAPCFPLVFEEYPDARVIVTHRDPLATLPSFCRLMESWCIAFDRDGCFDKVRFGRLAKHFIDRCLAVPMKFRDEHPEHASQIHDCRYQDLLSDPIGTVRRIYDAFGLDYTDDFERRMKRYLGNNQQGKHGRHRYSLEEYGFTPLGVCEAYHPYMERYGFAAPEALHRRGSRVGLATPRD